MGVLTVFKETQMRRRQKRDYRGEKKKRGVRNEE